MNSQTDTIDLHQPVHTALTQRVLVAGVPRVLFIMNTGIALAICLPLQQWLIGVPYYAIGHAIMAYLHNRDPWAFEIMYRHVNHPDYLDV